MKPHLLKVPMAPVSSFNVRKDVAPFFYNKCHYHPEMEIVLIEKGSGTKFIGDSITQFEEGEIVIVGPNLPHFWRCNDKYFAENSNLSAEAIVIHFNELVWGRDFLDLPENKHIKELFAKSLRGIRVAKSIQRKATVLMKLLSTSEGSKRIILLLQLLDFIANETENELLSSEAFVPSYDADDCNRINKICSYSLQHFKEKISLDEVAAVVNISPTSFCRYFKSKTKKNYSRYLQEIRIGHACKLLMKNSYSITQVCYESGFNNFANFYRAFKLITNKTPYQYQKEHNVISY